MTLAWAVRALVCAMRGHDDAATFGASYCRRCGRVA